MPLLIDDVLWRNWKKNKAERLWYTNAVIALVRSPKSRIVDNALKMQPTEDQLGWRRDKPIPHVENEPIPLGNVDESKLEIQRRQLISHARYPGVCDGHAHPCG